MADYREAFVGIDVTKLRNAIAIADAGREGEVRFFGEVDASDESMGRVIRRVTAKFDRVYFCYEAGPTGYGLYRLIRSLGYECMVVAPSLIPRKPGDRVIISPKLSDEDAKQRFPQGFETHKPYLRSVSLEA